MVRHLPLVLEVPGSTLAQGEENFCAQMMLSKCIVLRIGALTGCPARGRGGGGTLILSSYIGAGKHLPFTPQKISGISSTPKNI